MYDEYINQIKKLYNSGNTTELSFRTDFENLLNQINIRNKSNCIIIQESAGNREIGRPDFTIKKNGLLVGYIECKDIGIDIEKQLDTEQIKRYLSITNNLILTNYLDFIFLKNNEIERVSLCSIFDLKDKTPKLKGTDKLDNLLLTFFSTDGVEINSKEALSIELAKRTSIFKELVFSQLIDATTKEDDALKKLFNEFLKTISNKDLDEELFSDMYSQLVIFGLLFLRLSKNERLDKETVYNRIPNYIPLLKDCFECANLVKYKSNIGWVLDEIIELLNYVDITVIKESLTYKNLSFINKRDKNLKDPFLYFYEDFIKVYNKDLKIKMGVFYTPESVVSFIIRSLDTILKEKLSLKDGFLADRVKVLDFAVGTGTFILTLIEFVRGELSKGNNLGLWDSVVENFILKNIYGFELLTAPYILTHLKIHEYLEESGYSYSNDDKSRAQIYLTNTLEFDKDKDQNSGFFENMNIEAMVSYEIKDKDDILVIMGNPPYKKESKNRSNYIEKLMETYKYGVNEKNKKPLSNDYIKFIRFAHKKMEGIDKGVIGIITSNSYIDGAVYYVMREKLLETFDEIYILNLYGDTNKRDKCEDGTHDDNVFNIKEGVSIAFFIKTGQSKESKVYYYALQGKKEIKYNYLYENDITSVKWSKIELEKPNYYFKKINLNNREQYDRYKNITEIFNEYNTGVTAGRDNITINFDENSARNIIDDLKKLSIEELKQKHNLEDTTEWKLEEAKKDIVNKNYEIMNINYRPFDKRKIIYSKKRGILGRPRYNIMKHIILIENNIGLIFPRFAENKNPFFLSNNIIDSHLTGFVGNSSFIAPLYSYNEHFGNKPNFTNQFNNFLKNYHTNDPLKIFYYIYGITHSSTYYNKYKQFLKLDFPRIPFIEDRAIFDKIAILGEKLANLHLLKSDPISNICSFPASKTGDKNTSVTKIIYKNNQLHFNDNFHFEGVLLDVWEYTIGDYQVLNKWLSYRKKDNRVLDENDIKYIMKVINILADTIKIEKEIDEVSKNGL